MFFLPLPSSQKSHYLQRYPSLGANIGQWQKFVNKKIAKNLYPPIINHLVGLFKKKLEKIFLVDYNGTHLQK
jgi:hypothetical protein